MIKMSNLIRTSFLSVMSVAALSAFALPARAHDYKAGELSVAHPWARETTPGAKIGAGYLKVTNTGAAEDRLVAVETPAAEKVEIHESTEENGVARMRPLKDGVAIKPGEQTELKPGGVHLMLTGLKAPLVKGQRLPATLVFEKAGRLDVELAVEDMGFGGGSAPAAVHSHH